MPVERGKQHLFMNWAHFKADGNFFRGAFNPDAGFNKYSSFNNDEENAGEGLEMASA